MTETEEQDECVFPVCDGLFADTFSEESIYNFCSQKLKIRQVFSANLGVAAPVWDAALHLCRYLEKESFDMTGKRVIELGAGTGIVGILAARLGAEVTLTDLPHAIPQLQENVSANEPPCGWPSTPPTVLPLSWGLDQGQFSTDWDFVLGADIVYLSDTYTMLLNTLTHLCKGGGTLYLSSKMRREHGTPAFFENILPLSFYSEVVCQDHVQNINLYSATLRREKLVQ